MKMYSISVKTEGGSQYIWIPEKKDFDIPMLYGDDPPECRFMEDEIEYQKKEAEKAAAHYRDSGMKIKSLVLHDFGVAL